MAYEPINWDYDTPINPDNLNHMDKGIANSNWSEPKLFNITSSNFENNYPKRNYYIRCGNLILVSIWLVPTTVLNASTRYNVETDLPKPKEYHCTAGVIDHKFVHGTVFIDSNSQLRILLSQNAAIGDSFCAQLFYTTNE